MDDNIIAQKFRIYNKPHLRRITSVSQTGDSYIARWGRRVDAITRIAKDAVTAKIKALLDHKVKMSRTASKKRRKRRRSSRKAGRNFQASSVLAQTRQRGQAMAEQVERVNSTPAEPAGVSSDSRAVLVQAGGRFYGVLEL